MERANKIAFNQVCSKYCCIVFLLAMQPRLAFSQQQVSSIQNSFETFVNNNYQEKVFLHTDKTVYAIGEILWFKAYITDAVNNFSYLSKICYVEIITTDKRVLLQGKIGIDSGRGNGSFLLPASIRSGNYLIRAYTNWMRNFGSNTFFKQPITIINPNKKPELKKANTPDSIRVDFFPEGGNFVNGLDNNIAFKIMDANGKGINAKGFIVSGKDTITTFQTEKFGMGRFSLNPEKGKSYQAIIQSNNSTVFKELRNALNNGWVMQVKNESNGLSINVACNIISEQAVFLFIHTGKDIKKAVILPLINGKATAYIDKSELGDGVSEITVFNEKREPVSERLYFKQPENVMQIKIEKNQDHYKARNKVTINVTTADTADNAINADMSVAVYLTDSLQPEQASNLLNYLWLSSEIKGEIESPDYYFKNSGEEATRTADNLMLTQGWRRFKWEDVLKNTAPSFAFLPEHEGHVITGRLVSRDKELHDTGTLVYLSVPGKSFRFSNSISLSGKIRFNLEKFYGNSELIVQTNSADSNYQILIDDPFSEQFSDNYVTSFNLHPELTNKILLRSIAGQVPEIYFPQKSERFVIPQDYDTTAFYGIPYKTYYLDDYTLFRSMEEVIKEYVKEVHLKKRNKSFQFEVFNEANISYFKDEPLTLIDGVPVFNVSKIIDLDPLKIKRIDITACNFFKGKEEYNGIVSFVTYNGDLGGYPLNPNTLVIDYEGLQIERRFYSPTYETTAQQQSRLPDYRNVLYWSPKLESKKGAASFSFYTSDIPGKYILLIQGLSENGLAGSARASFQSSK
jgi:hypothetical protein